MAAGVQASEAFKSHGPLLTDLWSDVRELLYSTNPVKEVRRLDSTRHRMQYHSYTRSTFH